MTPFDPFDLFVQFPLKGYETRFDSKVPMVCLWCLDEQFSGNMSFSPILSQCFTPPCFSISLACFLVTGVMFNIFKHSLISWWYIDVYEWYRLSSSSWLCCSVSRPLISCSHAWIASADIRNVSGILPFLYLIGGVSPLCLLNLSWCEDCLHLLYL